ncbi:MAG TPA: FAD-dependent monooxygenase [Pseudonocardiaceae bacterium]|nr:FAD-dependent monooxygenase [Pseudonocardiaceae bacterium]
MTEQVPVIIVGGGLTGLSAALFLGQHGIKSLVVERHRSTANHPKARGFNARTMELFRNAGLERRVLAGGADLKENRDIVLCETLAQVPFQRVDKPRNDAAVSRVSPAQECLCPQDVLEPILLDAARELGADIRFNSELLDFDQDAAGVTATIDGQQVRADYLIACDGARSPIRQQLGIGMSRGAETFFSVGISFIADLADTVVDPYILAYVTHPGARGVMLPINNHDRWVFHLRFDPAAGESVDDFTEEHCERLIRAATGRPNLDIRLTDVAEWETTCALADRYRAGRTFIAGDAAHIIPPAGALGANTGIQDAHNLAWKLAFVVKGLAGPALLDTYEAERHPVGRLTVDQALLRWYSSERPSADADFLDDVAIMFGVRYSSSAVHNLGSTTQSSRPEPDGTPGTRAPHVWLGDNMSTVDLFGPEFTLMHESDQWVDAATRIDTPINLCQVHGFDDTALLVRPDGYVAWRGRAPALLPAVLSEVLGLPSESRLSRFPA